jgi:hypothetical protein
MLAAVQTPGILDINRLARLEIPQAIELKYIERDAFRGHHVVRGVAGLTLAYDKRSDPVRITKCDDTVPDDQGNDGVPSLASFVQRFDRIENLVGRGMAIRPDMQLVCEHIQQHL